MPSRHDKLLILDEKLKKLHHEHPIYFNLIAAGLAIVASGIAFLIEYLLEMWGW